MTIEGSLLIVALVFAFVNGFNDGGSLLAVGLSVRSIGPPAGLVLLTAAVVVTPVLFGTGVATTLSTRLVGIEGPSGQRAVLVAVATAVLVSYGLSRQGLPTSLTLALVGAIAGVGAGSGLPVSWDTVARVLIFAALAPAVGLLGGWALLRGLSWLPASGPLHRRIRRWHVVAFGAQCVAYGANDGQKMLAVVAVATGSIGATVAAVPWQLAAIGGLFLAGAVLGLPRFAGTIGTGVVAMQPPAAVITELSAATVVLGTAAIGSPVSMTQAISGALIGTSIPGGHGRIRWRAAARIGGAWLVTLPATFVLAGLVALVAFPAS